MNRENPSYYAIIPANVRYDKDIPSSAKLLYGEITCLSDKYGYCFASNKYFAELYGVSNPCISQWVKKLESKGYITVEYIYEGKEIKERRIRLADSYEGYKNNLTPIKSIKGGYKKKIKDNNTRDNNTSNRRTATTVANENLTPENIFAYYHENKLPVSPQRFWNYNNHRKWRDKNGVKIKDWKNAYLKMCESATVDEEYDSTILFIPSEYNYYQT